MKNVFKLFGVIALAAIIGFSMVACGGGDDDDPNPQSSGGLPAPSLTASPSGTVTAGTTIYLDWTSIAGASKYNFYVKYLSDGQWGSKSMSSTSATYGSDRDDAGKTVQFKVAAVNSNGTEGAHSNVVSITISGGSTQPSYSLDGVWESGGGRITVNGSTGVYSAFGTSAITQSAINKGYIKLGDTAWRYLTKTSTTTWSGQAIFIKFNTSSPNVATGTVWANNCTFTLSTNGQTLTITGINPVSGANFTATYTRR